MYKILCLIMSSGLLFSHGSLEVFNEYKNKYFVETGTHKGGGIKLAFQCGYDYIYSIELDRNHFLYNVNQFKDFSNVTIRQGSSANILKQIISTINEPITFFLDAHCVGDNPILSELNAIASHPLKTHTIIVDDVRMMGGHYFNGITLDAIKSRILSINKHYKFELRDCCFKNDLLVAYIPKS